MRVEDLLSKIKQELLTWAEVDAVYAEAYSKLNDVSSRDTAAISAALITSYHKLLKAESAGTLSVKETELLRNIENLDDALLMRK